MLKFICAGQELLLSHQRAIFWPRKRTLIVADTHFGKPVSFQRAGLALPNAVTGEDLDKLSQLISETEAETVLILGDFVHSWDSFEPRTVEHVEEWLDRHSKVDFKVIEGNHDQSAGDFPKCWPVERISKSLFEAPFLFSHQPFAEADCYVLAGHIHPGVVLRDRLGLSISAPCFWFSGHCGVLPAFGSATGISKVVPGARDHVFAAGTEELIRVCDNF